MTETVNIGEEFRKKARELLRKGEINAVIGYKKSGLPPYSKPHIALKEDDTDEFIFDANCVHNLVLYVLNYLLEYPEDKVAVLLKGCDQKSLIVLAQESKIDRERVKVIGFGCPGVIDPRKVEGDEEDAHKSLTAENVHDKCLYCDVRNTPQADIFIGEMVDIKPTKERYFREREFYGKKSESELLDFWKGAFSSCIRCYACRQVCPLCYCDICISYRNMPQWIELSPTTDNNMLFHVRRAMCMAGRCIDCGECERVCPVGIPLRLIYNKVSLEIEDKYDGYRAGMDSERKPPLQEYSMADPEDFIL